MLATCIHPLCSGPVPAVLEKERLCPLHFLRKVEQGCREIHRETLAGGLDGRRQAEINEFLAGQALALAQLATSGTRLADDARPCILNAFLTLINLCERVARLAGEDHVQAGRAGMRRPLAVTAWPAVGAKS
jgi:hypothetical protein